MCIGGIPKYLDYIEKDDSMATAINRLFFGQGAILRFEYNKLFQSLYQKKANIYKEVLINSFSTEITIGKTMIDLLSINNDLVVDGKKIERHAVRRIILDLVSSGFLTEHESFYKTKGKGNLLYYITDFYSIFTFTGFIKKDLKVKISGRNK